MVGNSPALTALCLLLSADLKVFKDFKVPIFPNVLFPLKKLRADFTNLRGQDGISAKNSIRSQLVPKSRSPLFYRRNCSNSLPIYTH